MTSWEEEESSGIRRDRAQTPAQKQNSSELKNPAETVRISLQSSIHLLLTMASHTSILLLIALWASLQDGLGLPVMEPQDKQTAQKVRTKRCACSSPLDSECHYFCHLDIVWINTPSKTTVYGLGRLRRSAGRCTCASPDDRTCTNFCYHSLETTSPEKSLKRRQLELLSILRAVASRFNRDESSEAQREFAR